MTVAAHKATEQKLEATTSSERFTLVGEKETYALTIGLEVHAQIASNAKLFSSAPTQFGAAPNAQVSFVDVAFPGMLPVLNERCVEQALKTSLGLEGTINLTSQFDRKNYFYPDLPQGYQITQFFKPIMENGFLDIDLDGRHKRIRINRLHIEQDAGKSLHDAVAGYSGVDLNRVGVGLMEIVSEPDLTSADEAVAYVKKLRTVLMCLETSDGNMEEGSLRVDANVSMAPLGKPLGVRVEIKNLNSFRFMREAILYEARRHIDVLEAGGTIVQETRLFDAVKKETRPMRSKEDAQEYRYFPDPDLPPLVLKQSYVDQVKSQLPELPDAKAKRFQTTLGLNPYDAAVITADLDAAWFFEEALTHLKKASPKVLANWVMGDVIAARNKDSVAFKAHTFKPADLAALLDMIEDQTLSGKMAKQVFEESWAQRMSPAQVVEQKGLKQIASRDDLLPFINDVLSAESDKVAAYQGGKEKLFGFFVGQVMKKTQGRASPALLNTLLKECLLTK